MSNKLTRLAREILNIEEDIVYRFDYSGNKKPYLDDFDIHIFQQIWPNTACGLGDIGGQAFTSANTIVFVPKTADQKCFVYFNGKFAYKTDNTEKFQQDLAKKSLVAVSMKGIYDNKKVNEQPKYGE